MLGEFGFPLAALAAAQAGSGWHASGPGQFRAGGNPAAVDLAVPKAAHRRNGGDDVGLVVGPAVAGQIVVVQRVIVQRCYAVVLDGGRSCRLD